jgi:hypothetical protein
MTLDLKDAIQNLHELPDLPTFDCSDGLLGVEKHAETCIALAARFVTAIEESVAGKELHERVVLFANLTGAGSEYGDLRTAAHESMIQLFKEASPDREVDRIGISPPYEGFKPRSERLAHGYLRRWDVNFFLGDTQSVLWSPYELLEFCDDLLELFDGQLLCSLVENLGALHGRMKAKHLWGAYLLAASHDAASAPTPDRYRRLRIAIMQSRGSVAAIKAAAEDIVATLPVDDGQTPMATEKPLAQPKAKNDYISLEEAGKMIGKHRTTATNKADKAGILEELAGHPVVSRKKWCEINGIDPDKQVRRKRHVAKPKAAPKGGVSSHDDVLYDEIEDLITDLFDEHSGKHLSINEIVATTVKKYPDTKQVDVVHVLHAAKKRGDYDQDDDRNWFRCKSE